jgi:hypothetical protein
MAPAQPGRHGKQRRTVSGLTQTGLGKPGDDPVDLFTVAPILVAYPIRTKIKRRQA